MKTTALFLSLLLGGSTLLGLRMPQDQEPLGEDELREHMESIEDAVKRLRRSLRDPANLAESLELVARMQSDALVCKGLVPPLADTLPEAERAAFCAAFRRMMVDFLGAQLELEAALLDGDAEKADAAFARVRDFEDTGHERFTLEEDE